MNLEKTAQSEAPWCVFLTRYH